MLHLLGLLLPEPLSPQQSTADPCLHRKPSDTHGQVRLSLSLVEVTAAFPGFAQGLVCTQQASLVGMRFKFKHVSVTALRIVPSF